MGKTSEKSIVIIDDSRTSLQIMQTLIKEEFPTAMLHLFASSNGIFSKLNRILPDLYIINVHMPQVNGFDILSKIENNQVPIYFVSSATDLWLLEKAFSMGVSEFFVKPFNIPSFKSKVQNVLKTN